MGIINKDLLPGNDCFGCGHDNAAGLKIEVFRDPENSNQLLGRFQTSRKTIGFPGITHGGAIYTAMDCLASWVPTILRSEIKAAWVLRSANIKYLRPAREGIQISLSGSIVQEGKKGKPLVVQIRACNAKGDRLAEGQFKVVPLSMERFKEIAGIDQLPENWKVLLSDGEPPPLSRDPVYPVDSLENVTEGRD
ncbi:MAG: PaaI family thioesterase [Nitrospira sp.]